VLGSCVMNPYIHCSLNLLTVENLLVLIFGFFFFFGLDLLSSFLSFLHFFFSFFSFLFKGVCVGRGKHTQKKNK
jgi:hypothetical protein